MTKTFRRSLTFVAIWVFSAAAPARGWNDVGHMAVGYVAYHHLTTPTQSRVSDVERFLAVTGASNYIYY